MTTRLPSCAPWLAALGAALACVPVPPEAANSLGPTIDTLAGPYVEAGSLSGVVAVSHGSGAPLIRTYGRASLDSAVSVTAATRFLIGSVTKSFTAAAVLALRARGELDLDLPVGRYLEGFPYGDRITARLLLAHQSGLGNLFFLPDYAELAREHHTAREVVGLVGGLPLSFSPGSRTAYNNVNYSALAWLIEARSGHSYAEVVKTELLEPLGLTHTSVVERADQAIPDLARGTDPVGMTGLTSARFNDPTIFVGSGSMASTATDLIQWIEAIAGGRVARDADRELLLDFARLRDDFRGRPAISATGWDGVGYAAHVLHVPGDSLTVAVLVNLNISGVATEIANGVASLALGLEPEVMPLKPSRLPMDSLGPLAGLYRFGPDFYAPGGTLRIVARDGGLYDIGRKPEIGLLPLADGDFLYRATWSRVHFRTADDNQAGALTFAGRFEAQREGPAATP